MMEDAMMRQRIHELLEKKIELQGGRRRRRRRAPAGRKIISPRTGKLISYKKYLQGKRLAQEYGFKKGGGSKRAPRRRMRGRGYVDDNIYGYGYGDDVYGYGYVPDLYHASAIPAKGENPEIPAGPKHPVGFCHNGVPGPYQPYGPYFFNDITGKCENSLYGPELQKAIAKYLAAESKKIAREENLLTKQQKRELAAYEKAQEFVNRGERVRIEPTSLKTRKAQASRESELISEALGEILKKPQ